jgi:flagellar biosynthesis protein FlhG
MNPTRTRTSTEPRGGALAITGSKGGVGKSNLALNLAVALGRWGRRVLLVDGDLGLANLDVLMGLVPDRTVEHLVRGEADLNEVLAEGPEGVRVLPAASGVPDLARLDEAARGRLLTRLAEGAGMVDDVLVDTGAGLGDATLALQLAASRVVVVTTPEPTSLVDAYASLKVLWNADRNKTVDLVVNAARDEEEADRAHEQIARAASHFLGRAPGRLGAVYRDPKVAEAVRRQRPVLELYPDCPASRCYERIATRLASTPVVAGRAADYWRHLMVPATAGEELPH